MCKSSFDPQFSLSDTSDTSDTSDDENAVNVKDEASTERYLSPNRGMYMMVRFS